MTSQVVSRAVSNIFTSSSKINRRLSFACLFFQNKVRYSMGRPRDLVEIEDNGSKMAVND